MAWYWAGDTKKGKQDKWIVYDDDTTEKLEKAFKANEKKVKIDDERFVDISDHDNMVQRRYDDHNKQRDVKRESINKKEDEKEEEEEKEEDEEKTVWYWAGDAKKKNGPTPWIEYDDVTTSKLEVAYRRKKSKVKIDDERFVDLSDRDNIAQRRYDDISKMRNVKREIFSSTSSSSKAKKLKTSPTTTTTTTSTAAAATTSGRRQKNDASLKQLTAYEQQEYAMALDPRLNVFYSDSTGLHEELVDKTPTNKEVKRDRHSNPAGAEYDLGRDGAFKGFTVLLGRFVAAASLSLPEAALKKKGFKVINTTDESKFLELLPQVDVAWIISGTDPHPRTITKTSSKESYPAWTKCPKERFQKEVMKFHCDGGGLFLWGDNDPLFEHANAVLPLIMKNAEVVLCGNTEGNQVLKVGSATTTQQFAPHIITSGVVSLYEGITICYPKKLGDMKVLATSSDGFPAICYVDHEFLDAKCGRVLVDTGYTKNFSSWDAAGTARYIINGTVWLLGLERKLLQGDDVTTPRVKRSQAKN